MKTLKKMTSLMLIAIFSMSIASVSYAAKPAQSGPVKLDDRQVIRSV